jgi:O-antigen biosynthesis protein
VRNPFCSVIILNYNGEKVIKDAINSLLRLDYPKDRFEIIIVDNGSHDLSKGLIESFTKNNTNIKSIFLKKNLGFSKGNNIGIKEAKGEYVALVNNDCFVTKDWLREIISTAQKDKNVFAVNSKILLKTNLQTLDRDTTKQIQNAGIVMFQDGYGRDRGAIIGSGKQFYEADKNQYEEEKEVYAACAAAVLYRRELLKKIGYLDESFFMYYEDVEISERARGFGFKSVYSPKAVVEHSHAMSSKENSPFFIYQVEKGRLLHMFYNFPFKVFFSEYLKFLIKSKLRFLRSLIKLKNPILEIQYVKVAAYFVFYFPFILNQRIIKRKKYNKNSIDINFESLISGKWLFKL